VAVIEIDGKLACSCGAKADRKDRRRFLRRHADGACGARKAEREAFTKQLAQGTRCVDDNERQMARQAPEE
jgi:hypothetical protein